MAKLLKHEVDGHTISCTGDLKLGVMYKTTEFNGGWVFGPGAVFMCVRYPVDGDTDFSQNLGLLFFERAKVYLPARLGRDYKLREVPSNVEISLVNDGEVEDL